MKPLTPLIIASLLIQLMPVPLALARTPLQTDACNPPDENFEIRELAQDALGTANKAKLRREATLVYRTIVRGADTFENIGEESFLGNGRYYIPGHGYTKEELPQGMEDFWDRKRTVPVVREVVLRAEALATHVAGDPEFRAIAIARLVRPREANEKTVEVEALLLRLNPLQWVPTGLNLSHLINVQESSTLENSLDFDLKPESKMLLEKIIARNRRKSVAFFVKGMFLTSAPMTADKKSSDLLVQFSSKEEMEWNLREILETFHCEPITLGG